LTSSSEGFSADNGSYTVSAVTSRAPLDISIIEQPVSSILKLAAITSHSSVNATLPAAYEGKFTLITSKSGSSVVAKNDDTEDPSGHGRKRLLNVKEVFGSIIAGDVKWVASDLDDIPVLSALDEGVEYDDDRYEAWDVEDRDDLAEGDGPREVKADVALITSEGNNFLYFN